MALVLLMVLLTVVSVEMKVLETESAKTAEKRDSVCYGTLGCFATEGAFTSSVRPVAVVPESPDSMQTKFLLYTREAKTSAQSLDARHPETATSVWSHFGKRPTKILIHGFMDSPVLTSLWHDMRDELLTHGDYNVVIVDWSGGNLPPYDQACANARVVGAQIGEMIKERVKSSVGVTEADFHIIGHSLGAHVCGYAGERVPGLGRITGLDPAGPYFENTDKVVQLDASDAVYVDAIHTDGKNLLQLGLGMKQQSGHADFYPNSGHDQPGCTRDPITNIFENGLIQGIEETVACSHVRAVRFFTESINSQCPFMGFPCASEDDYNNNLCHTCPAGGCVPMGLNADSNKPANGQSVKYYLATASHKPFCQYHLTVTLKLANGQGGDERGTLGVTVAGETTSTAKISLTGDSDPVALSPGHTYKYYVLIPTNFGNVQSVTFTWNQQASILDPFHWNILGLRHPKIYLDEIDIYREEAGVDVHFCTQAASVETGSSLTISTKC